MKIRKLQLKNIGVFDDETIEFQPCPAKDKAEIHIFTGQNGSGKSTILMALASVFDNYERGFSPSDIRNNFSKRFRNTLEENGIKIVFDDSTTTSLKIFNGNALSEYESYPKMAGRFAQIEKELKLSTYKIYLTSKDYNPDMLLDFAVFAFSGYRQIESEWVETNRKPKIFNPLSQSLNFVKDYSQENEMSINQLVVNYISNRALARDEKSFVEAEKYEKVLLSIQELVSYIADYEIEFIFKRQQNELKLKIHGEELDFDILPDGLRSLISWIADLLGRVDLLKWQDDLPIFEKNLILLLDEIEVHLHPAWQRKVLPVVQKLFKNSQIFVSTHSPFVVNSVDDAWVYKLELENGKAKVSEPIKSEDGISYQTVLSEIFGIDKEFGGKTQDDLDKFYGIVRNGKKIDKRELRRLAKSLAVQSEELNAIVQIELRQLSRRKGKEFSI